MKMKKGKVFMRLLSLLLSIIMLIPTQTVYAGEGKELAEWKTSVYAESRENDADEFQIVDGVLKRYTGTASEVTIPDSVTSIGYGAFSGCRGLTSVSIPNSVVCIEYSAFRECIGLTSINIPDSVTNIEFYAFYCCKGLTSISIPDSVTSIGFDAFAGCSGLTSISIPESVTSIGNGAFSYCSGLTSIEVKEGNPKYDSRDSCNAIIETETNTLVQGCKNTVIPSSVTRIGDGAFIQCSGLISIVIPDSITNIGYVAFADCSGLTSISIPDSVTGIEGRVFEGCRGLTSITIPSSVTSIGNGVFSYCSGLTSIEVEGGNPKYDSRNNCNAVIETETNTLVQGCKNTVILPSVVSIGENAFFGCIGLTSINIPDGVTSIENGAFYGCSELTSIFIPESVKNIKEDGQYLTFYGCSKELTIYGKTGSYAETFAKENDIKFFSIGDETDNPLIDSAIYTYGTKSIDLLTTAHSIESTHNPFDLICTPKDSGSIKKYELYSGSKKVAESADGSFKQVKASEFTAGKDVSIKSYGDKKAVTTQLLLEVKDKNPLMKSSLDLGGEGVAFTLDDDVPFIGGSKISVNFPEVPINVVVEDGKIKVGINITKEPLYSYNSYEGVTTTTKEKSMKQKIADWKKTLYKTTLINQDWKGYLEKGNLEADIPFFSKDKSLTVFGYAEGEWSDSFESLEGEIVIAISTSRTWQSKPIVVFQTVPVTFNCKLDAKGKADGTLKVDFAKNDCFGDVTLSGEIAIEPYAGVGVGTWLSLGVYGQLKTGMDYTLLTSPNSEKTRGLDEISLYGEAGAKGYFAKKEVVRVPVFSMGDLKNTNLGQFIDSGNKLLIYSRGKNSLVNKKSVRSNSVSLSDEVFAWSEENASVYMSPYVADSGNRAVTLIENAYGAAEPQIITAGDTTLVAYLDNDEGRALPNQTVVKYAVYNPITGAFSEPQIVLDDDTADYKPQLYTDGTDIYAYYLDSTKIYGETDDPDISEYAETFAVTVAKYDEDSENFTKLGTMSLGNHYCYSPTLTSMGDSLFLAWAENGSDQVFGLTQDNSVNYSIYKDGEWCEPVNVSAELNSITSIAIDDVDGKRKIAYCVDADNDLTTTEQQLYLSDESGTITKCMEDIVSNLQYIQLPELGHKVLVFNRNGAVAYIENADDQPVELFEEQMMDSGSQFMVQGDKIYYLKTDENSRNVCCANYAEGKWGTVGLTDESSYIDAFSVTNGMLVYLATEADLDSSEDIQTSSNIKILSSMERHDLAINNVSFDELNMVAGEDLELEVDITNNGTETVSNPIVTFYRNRNASLSQSVPLSVSIQPGETVHEKITVTAPEDFKDAVYSLKIEETVVTDDKGTDNVAEVDLSKTELDVSTEYKMEQGKKSLLVRVSNDSNVSSKADVSVSDTNGDVIYTEDNVNVPANDSMEISVPIEESLLRKNVDVIYTATVNTDKEEYYLCNNTYEQRVWQIETWEPVVSDIPDKDDGDGEENNTTYAYKLNDDETTITITKCTSSVANITIPSTIDGYKVTGIGDKAFQNVTSMKTVSFPSTLKSIGNYAFAGCTSLTTVTLPDSLTNLGTYVFKGCISLKSTKLNAGRINVTEGLFHGCTLLSSVTLPSSVQYIREYAFYGCSSLKTLSLPKSLVTVFNNAFLSSGIKSIKYAGTSTNWKKITIYLTGNTKFLNATVTGSDGKTFSADSSKWNSVKPVKKPTVAKVKSFKAKAGKKKLTLSWKKLSGVAGYQIQISTKKNFKGAKKISISKLKKTYTKKSLKAKKKYYIRMRAYKTYKDANPKTQKVYGKWTTISKKTK